MFKPNRFYAVKEQASGWPEWATTDQLKRQHVRQMRERDDVDLDPEKIEKTPGLRQVAKLMLNSFWGWYNKRYHYCEHCTNKKLYYLKFLLDFLFYFFLSQGSSRKGPT